MAWTPDDTFTGQAIPPPEEEVPASDDLSEAPPPEEAAPVEQAAPVDQTAAAPAPPPGGEGWVPDDNFDGTPGYDADYIPAPGLGGGAPTSDQVAAANPPEPGPFDQAIHNAGDALGAIAEPILDQAPEGVQNVVDAVGQPFGGAVDAIGDVTHELGQGDLAGAVGAGLGALSGPQNRVVEQTVSRLDEGKPAIPHDEVMQDPGDILAILGGLATTYGPVPAVSGLTLEDWWKQDPVAASEIYRTQGAAGVHDAWTTAAGASDNPPAELSNPFDAGTSSNPIERAGQVAGAVPDFLSGWGQSAKAGTLAPFVLNQAQQIVEDPTSLIPGAVGEHLGGVAKNVAADAIGKVPVVGPALRRAGELTPGEQARLGAEKAGASLDEYSRAAGAQQGTPIGWSPDEPNLNQVTPERHGGYPINQYEIVPGADGTAQVWLGDRLQAQFESEDRAAEYATTPRLPLDDDLRRRTSGATNLDDLGGPLTVQEAEDLQFERNQNTYAANRTQARLAQRDATRGTIQPAMRVESPTGGGVTILDPEDHPMAGALHDRFKEYGLDGYDLVLVRKIDDILPREKMGSEFGPSAFTEPNLKLIVVALEHQLYEQLGSEGKRVGPISALDHEVVHGAKNLDLFTPTEWRTLVQQARDVGLGRYLNDNPAYSALKGVDAESELVAHLYQYWQEGKLLNAAPSTGILQKLQNWLTALGHALKDTYPEEVLGRIASGEVTRRQPGVGAVGDIGEPQFSDINYRLFHASDKTNIRKLRANPPGRNFDWASSRLGVFLTPSEETAFNDWLPARYGTIGDVERFRKARELFNAPASKLTPDQAARRANAGRIYEAMPSLEKTHDMSSASFAKFYEPTAKAIREAEALKKKLVDEGYDGIVVWDGQPRVKADGSIRPGDEDYIREVISFKDVPVKRRQYLVPAGPGRSLAEILEDPTPSELDDVPESQPPAEFDPLLPDRVPQEKRQFRPLEQQEFAPGGAAFRDYIKNERGEIRRGDGFAVYNDLGAEAAQQVIDDALERAWREAGYTPEEWIQVERATGFTAPTAEYLHAALSMPESTRFWYALSGEAFKRYARLDPADFPEGIQRRLGELGIHTSDDMMEFLIRLTAATSGAVKPTDNLKIALAALIETMKAIPTWSPRRDPGALRQALQGRIRTLKFGNFSNDLQTHAGVRVPIGSLTTNDLQIAHVFGLADNGPFIDPKLFEVAHRFQFNLAEDQNLRRPGWRQGTHLPLEPKEVQSSMWVMERYLRDKQVASKDRAVASWDHRPLAEEARRSRGGAREMSNDDIAGAANADHYGMAFENISALLQDTRKMRGEIPLGPNGEITAETLMDPRVLNNFASTRKKFDEGIIGNIPIAGGFSDHGEMAMSRARQAAEADPARFSNTVPATEEFLRASATRAFKQMNYSSPGAHMRHLLNDFASVITGRAAAFPRVDYTGLGRNGLEAMPIMHLPMFTDKGPLPLEAAQGMLSLIGRSLNVPEMRATQFLPAAEGLHDTFTVWIADPFAELEEHGETLERMANGFGGDPVARELAGGIEVKMVPDPDRPVLSQLEAEAVMEAILPPTSAYNVSPSRYNEIRVGSMDYDAHISREMDRAVGNLAASNAEARRINEERAANGTTTGTPRDPARGNIGDVFGRDGLNRRLEALDRIGAEAQLDRAAAERAVNEYIANPGRRAAPNFAAAKEALRESGFLTELTEQSRNRQLQFAARAATEHWPEELRDQVRNEDTPNPAFWRTIQVSDDAVADLESRAAGRLVFRDGWRPDAETLGDVADQTRAGIETWIQGFSADGAPGRWAAGGGRAQREWERLQQRYNPNGDIDVTPMLYGSVADGADTKAARARADFVGVVLKDALERGLPKEEAGRISRVLGGYTNFIRQSMLFNVLNVPRYILQNLIGNTANIVARGGGLKPAWDVWTDFAEMKRIYGNQRDPSAHATTLDSIFKQIGMGDRPNLGATQRRYFDRISPDGELPRGLQVMMSLGAPEAARFLGSVPDILGRNEVGIHAIQDGYHELNKQLAPALIEELRHRIPTQMIPPDKVAQVVRDFQDQWVNLEDGVTGLPMTGMFGKVRKYEAMWNPDEFGKYMREHLAEDAGDIDTGQLNRAINEVMGNSRNQIKAILDGADAKADYALFPWRETNADAMMSTWTLFHYYMSRQGGFYVSEGLKRPWIAASYGRMMAEMQKENDERGGPAWLTGWFQFQQSPAGFSTFWSPFDAIGSLLTMADWQMAGDPDAMKDLTDLGRAFRAIPFFIHPGIQFVGYELGLLGPDYPAPPITGLETFGSKAIDLLNLANAQGAPFMDVFNAMGVGVDSQGNKVPIPPRPLQDLYASVGNAISTAFEPITGLSPVEVAPSSANLTRNVQTMGEQLTRMDHPHWDQMRVDRHVTDVLADPGNAEYTHWYAAAAQIPFQAGNLPQPLGGLARLASPVGMTSMPEQRALDSMGGLAPSGVLPPRKFPEGDMATDIGYEAKYGGAKTVQGRQLTELNNDYKMLIPQELKDVRSTVNAISGGYLPEGGIDVGGVHYSNEDLQGMSRTDNYNVRQAYLAEQGYSYDDIQGAYDAEAEFKAEHPDFAAYETYKDLINQAGGATPDENAQIFATQMAQTNPSFAQYMRSEMTDHQTGEIKYDKVWSPDAYLAAQGVRPSVYSPTVGNDPSRAAGGYPSIPGVTEGQPLLPRVNAIADIPIFNKPGDADQGYYDDPPLAIISPDLPMQIIDPRINSDDGLVQVAIGNYIGFVDSSLLNNSSPSRPIPGNEPAPSPGGGLAGVGGAVLGTLGAAKDALGGLLPGGAGTAEPYASGVVNANRYTTAGGQTYTFLNKKGEPNTPNYGYFDSSSTAYPDNPDGTRALQPIYIVYHYTAGKSMDDFIGEFMGDTQRASSNYVLDKDGTLYTLVPDKYSAWANGDADMLPPDAAPGANFNQQSISIEIVNDGTEPYTPEQIEALKHWTHAETADWGIPADHLIGHSDVTSYKSDPGPLFPWDEIRAAAAA